MDIETHVEDLNDNPNVEDSNDNPNLIRPDPKKDLSVQIFVENLVTRKNTGILYVKPSNFGTLSTTSTNVMIPKDVSDREAKISALNKKISNAPDWPVVMKKIITFIKQDSNGSKVVLVAWNGTFYDFPLIEYENIRHRMDFRMSSLVEYYFDAMVFVKNSDYWERRDKPVNWKLETVFKHMFPESTYTAHDAASDTTAMIEILLHFLGNNVNAWLSQVSGLFHPVSWKGVDLRELDEEKKEIALGSLAREQAIYNSNPVMSNQAWCQRIIDELDPSKLIKGDDDRLSPEARYWDCIYYESSDGAVRKYPSIATTHGSLPLYRIACIAKNGPMQIVNFDDYRLFQTASHLCGDDYCINQDHLTSEPLVDNLGRIGCKGYIRILDEDRNIDMRLNAKECLHDERCMTFLTVGRESDDTDEDFDTIVEHFRQKAMGL